MRIELKRQLSAWLLLSVLLPMVVLSALHVHPSACAESSVECEACVHHQSHGGHLSAAGVHLHECVLCQFLSLVFLPAAAALLSLFVRRIGTSCLLRNALVLPRAAGAIACRAPPAV